MRGEHDWLAWLSAEHVHVGMTPARSVEVPEESPQLAHREGHLDTLGPWPRGSGYSVVPVPVVAPRVPITAAHSVLQQVSPRNADVRLKVALPLDPPWRKRPAADALVARAPGPRVEPNVPGPHQPIKLFTQLRDVVHEVFWSEVVFGEW